MRACGVVGRVGKAHATFLKPARGVACAPPSPPFSPLLLFSPHPLSSGAPLAPSVSASVLRPQGAVIPVPSFSCFVLARPRPCASRAISPSLALSASRSAPAITRSAPVSPRFRPVGQAAPVRPRTVSLTLAFPASRSAPPVTRPILAPSARDRRSVSAPPVSVSVSLVVASQSVLACVRARPCCSGFVGRVRVLVAVRPSRVESPSEIFFPGAAGSHLTVV